MFNYPTKVKSGPLLSLVRDLHTLASVQLHASRILLRGDGTSLVLVLDERNAPTARDKTNLAEALETAKDVGEGRGVDIVGQVLDEEDLIGRQVLVWHNGGGGGAGWLEACASCRLCGTTTLFSSGGGALEALLFGLESLLLVCARETLVPGSSCCRREEEVALLLPFSAVRLRLWSSKSSSDPNFCTVASLLVFARAACRGLPNRSKPSTSSAACLADSGLSKTMKAWPLAFRLVLATISMTFPKLEKSSRSVLFRGSILTRSSMFRT